MQTVRRLDARQALWATAAYILVALALAYFTDIGGSDDADDPGAAAYVVVSAIAIGVAAGAYLWLIPRSEERDPATTTLVLGILAFLTVLVFWTGLPFALGFPALFLGASALDRAGRSSMQVKGGMALAAIGVLGATVACIFG